VVTVDVDGMLDFWSDDIGAGIAPVTMLSSAFSTEFSALGDAVRGQWKPDLHPRDSHGRFRDKWTLSPKARQIVERILAGFDPVELKSDNHAASYLNQHKKPRSKGQEATLDYFLTREGNEDIQSSLRAGLDTKRPSTQGTRVRDLDGMMAPLDNDLILSRVVGPDAFGLPPERIGEVEEWTGKLIDDLGYAPTNIGTPHPIEGPHIEMRILAPRGTKAIVKGDGSRTVVLDREQPLQLDKIQSDGRGGFYILATVMPRSGSGTAPRALGRELAPGEKSPAIEATPDELARRGLTPEGSPLPQSLPPAGTPAPNEQPVQPNIPPAQGPPAETKPVAEVPLGAGKVVGPDTKVAPREKIAGPESKQVMPEDQARLADEQRRIDKRQAALDAREARMARLQELDNQRLRQENEQLRQQVEGTPPAPEAPAPIRADRETQTSLTRTEAQKDADVVRRYQKLRDEPGFPRNSDEERIQQRAEQVMAGKPTPEPTKRAPRKAAPAKAAPVKAAKAAPAAKKAAPVKKAAPAKAAPAKAVPEAAPRPASSEVVDIALRGETPGSTPARGYIQNARRINRNGGTPSEVADELRRGAEELRTGEPLSEGDMPDRLGHDEQDLRDITRSDASTLERMADQVEAAAATPEPAKAVKAAPVKKVAAPRAARPTSITQLRREATQLKVPGRSTMDRDQLEAALEARRKREGESDEAHAARLAELNAPKRPVKKAAPAKAAATKATPAKKVAPIKAASAAEPGSLVDELNNDPNVDLGRAPGNKLDDAGETIRRYAGEGSDTPESLRERADLLERSADIDRRLAGIINDPGEVQDGASRKDAAAAAFRRRADRLEAGAPPAKKVAPAAKATPEKAMTKEEADAEAYRRQRERVAEIRRETRARDEERKKNRTPEQVQRDEAETARIQELAKRTGARVERENAEADAAIRDITTPWKNMARVEDKDLSDFDRVGIDLVADQLRHKRISKAEAARRLSRPDEPDDSPMNRIAKAITAPRSITLAQKKARARKWGQKHGYEGRAGGWIHDSKGKPVAHGWDALYNQHTDAIEKDTAPSVRATPAKKATGPTFKERVAAARKEGPPPPETPGQEAARERRHQQALRRIENRKKAESADVQAHNEARRIITSDGQVNSSNLRQALVDAHGEAARSRVLESLDTNLNRQRKGTRFYGEKLPATEWRKIARDLGVKGMARSDSPTIKAAILKNFADVDEARKADIQARNASVKDRSRDVIEAQAILDSAKKDPHYHKRGGWGRNSFDTDRGGDLLGEKIAEAQGFDQLPEVVSREEFEQRRGKDIGLVLYRGVNTTGRAEPGMGGEFKGKPASEVHDEFREGRYHMGIGSFGNGTYMTRNSQHAKGYSDLTEGAVARYGLSKDAKIVELPDLIDEHNKYMEGLPETSRLRRVFGDDIGRYAMSRGYDAIHVPRGSQAIGVGPEGAKDQYVILNRGKVIAEAPGAVGTVAEARKAVRAKKAVPRAAGRTGDGDRVDFEGMTPPQKALSKRAAKGIAARVAAKQEPEAPPAKAVKAVPKAMPAAKKAAAPKFLRPLADGTPRKSATNLEVGDIASNSYRRDRPPMRVTKLERNGNNISVTFEDGSVDRAGVNWAYWIGPRGGAKKAAPGPGPAPLPPGQGRAVTKALPIQASTPGENPAVRPGGKIALGRLRQGDTVLVHKNDDGTYRPASRKTGAIPVKVDRVEQVAATGGFRRTTNRMAVIGTDPDGNEITVGYSPASRRGEGFPGHQTFMYVPKSEPVKAAKKAAPAKAVKAAPAKVAKAAVPAAAPEGIPEQLPTSVTALRKLAKDNGIPGHNELGPDSLRDALRAKRENPNVIPVSAELFPPEIRDKITPAGLREIGKSQGVDLEGKTTDELLTDLVRKSMLKGADEKVARATRQEARKAAAAKKLSEKNDKYGPDGPSHLDLDKVTEGMDIDASHRAVLDDAQARLNSGDSPAQVAKELRDRAQGLETHNAYVNGGWGHDVHRAMDPLTPEERAKAKADDKAKYNAEKARAKQLRDVADRLEKTRRPVARKAAPPKATPAKKAATPTPTARVGKASVGPEHQRSLREAVKKAAPSSRRVSERPYNARDRNRLTGAGDEAAQERIRQRANELYDGSRTVAAAWRQALDEHEAANPLPGKKAVPAVKKLPTTKVSFTRGTRVRDENGTIGRVTSLSDDGKHVNVRWDNGVLQSHRGIDSVKVVPPETVRKAPTKAEINGLGNEDEVEALLKERNPTVAELRKLATEVGPHVSTKGTKAQLMKNIASGSEPGMKNRPARLFAEPKVPAKKAVPKATRPMRVGDMVPEGETIPEPKGRQVSFRSVQGGDIATWDDRGTLRRGRVVDDGPRRRYVDWEGGRRERLNSAARTGVTFHKAEAAPTKAAPAKKIAAKKAAPAAGVQEKLRQDEAERLRAEIKKASALGSRGAVKRRKLQDRLQGVENAGHAEDVAPEEMTPDGKQAWADSYRQSIRDGFGDEVARRKADTDAFKAAMADRAGAPAAKVAPSPRRGEVHSLASDLGMDERDAKRIDHLQETTILKGKDIGRPLTRGEMADQIDDMITNPLTGLEEQRKDFIKKHDLDNATEAQARIDRWRQLEGRVRAAASARAVKKAMPAKKAAPGGPGDLAPEELIAIRDLSAKGHFTDTGWVRSTDLKPEQRKHLDGLAEKGYAEKRTTAEGDFFRIDKRGFKARQPTVEGQALEGDVIPAKLEAEHRLPLHKINRGAVIQAYRDPNDPSKITNVPETGVDPSRVVRVQVQRIDRLGEDKQPVKGAQLPWHARIVGHDLDTGRRVDSDVNSIGSHWNWELNPDTDTSPDIEGEVVQPKKAVTAAKKAVPKAAPAAKKTAPAKKAAPRGSTELSDQARIYAQERHDSNVRIQHAVTQTKKPAGSNLGLKPFQNLTNDDIDRLSGPEKQSMTDALVRERDAAPTLAGKREALDQLDRLHGGRWEPPEEATPEAPKATMPERRPELPRAIDTSAKRRLYVQDQEKLTREQFDALPQEQRDQIVSNLHEIGAMDDVPRAFRDSMGSLVRGATRSPHNDAAKRLERRFTEPYTPKPTRPAKAASTQEALDRIKAIPADSSNPAEEIDRALSGMTNREIGKVAAEGGWYERGGYDVRGETRASLIERIRENTHPNTPTEKVTPAPEAPAATKAVPKATPRMPRDTEAKAVTRTQQIRDLKDRDAAEKMLVDKEVGLDELRLIAQDNGVDPVQPKDQLRRAIVEALIPDEGGSPAKKAAAKASVAAAKSVPSKTPPAGTRGTGGGGAKYSTKPLLDNNWGGGGGPIHYHDHGPIGLAVQRMGNDKTLDIDGEPLANRVGILATDGVTGRKTTQEVIEGLREIRDKTPAGSKAREQLDHAIKEIDFPPRTGSLPDDALPPVRELMRNIEKVPLARGQKDRYGNDRFNEMDYLTDLAEKFDRGDISGLDLIGKIRDLTRDRHESEGAEGKFEMDRYARKAADDLEKMYRDPNTRKQLARRSPDQASTGRVPEVDTSARTPTGVDRALQRLEARNRNRRIERTQAAISLAQELRDINDTDRSGFLEAVRQRVEGNPGDVNNERDMLGQGHQDLVEALGDWTKLDTKAKVEARLKKYFEDRGITEERKVGDQVDFDPDTMDTFPGVDIAPGDKVEVVRTGYRYRDKDTGQEILLTKPIVVREGQGRESGPLADVTPEVAAPEGPRPVPKGMRRSTGPLGEVDIPRAKSEGNIRIPDEGRDFVNDIQQGVRRSPDNILDRADHLSAEDLRKVAGYLGIDTTSKDRKVTLRNKVVREIGRRMGFEHRETSPKREELELLSTAQLKERLPKGVKAPTGASRAELVDMVMGDEPSSPRHASLTPAQEEIKHAFDEGMTDVKSLGGGSMGRVTLTEGKDGRKYVRKRVRRDWFIGAEEQADSETLWSRAAREIGIGAPAVYSPSQRTVVMDHVPWKLASKHSQEEVDAAVATPEGRRLHILDLITGNVDRHNDNWMIDDQGRPVPIDNALSFRPEMQGTAGSILAPSANGETPPAALHGLDPFRLHYKAQLGNYDDIGIAKGNVRWAQKVDFDRDELLEIRDKLQSLKPEFTRLGRDDWHDDMMGRLDALITRARAPQSPAVYQSHSASDRHPRDQAGRWAEERGAYSPRRYLEDIRDLGKVRQAFVPPPPPARRSKPVPELFPNAGVNGTAVSSVTLNTSPQTAPYTIAHGTVWKRNGATFLVEHEDTPAGRSFAQSVQRSLERYHGQLPDPRYARSYTWANRPNPEDAYWQQRYKIPDFSSAASADGDGNMTLWNRSYYRGDEVSEVLDHEYGHGVDHRNPLGISSDSPQWAQAAKADNSTRGSVQDFRPRNPGPARAVLMQPSTDPKVEFPDGVTTYGASNREEDYAESMRLYMAGVIGWGRREPGGPLEPIWFRDLFPTRARLLDQVLPQFAYSQQGEILRIRSLPPAQRMAA